MALRAVVGASLYVDALADLAAAEGEDRLTARLSSAAETCVAAVGAALPPFAGDRVRRLATLRERLGDDAFETEVTAGRALALEDAAAAARGFALAPDRNRLDAGL